MISNSGSHPCVDWIINSVYTYHICPYMDWFNIYKAVLKSVGMMENNTSYKITKIELVKSRMFDIAARTLIDLRHVPNLKKNLQSLSTLDAKLYKYIGKCRVLKVCRCTKTTKRLKLWHMHLEYVLKGSTVIGNAAVTISLLRGEEVIKLWHMHLGHMSEQRMAELSKK